MRPLGIFVRFTAHKHAWRGTPALTHRATHASTADHKQTRKDNLPCPRAPATPTTLKPPRYRGPGTTGPATVRWVPRCAPGTRRGLCGAAQPRPLNCGVVAKIDTAKVYGCLQSALLWVGEVDNSLSHSHSRQAPMGDSNPQSQWVLGQGDDPNALCGKMAPDFAMTDISCDPPAQSLRIPSHPSLSAVRLLQHARRASHHPSCTDATGQSQCVATHTATRSV